MEIVRVIIISALEKGFVLFVKNVVLVETVLMVRVVNVVHVSMVFTIYFLLCIFSLSSFAFKN